MALYHDSSALMFVVDFKKHVIFVLARMRLFTRDWMDSAVPLKRTRNILSFPAAATSQPSHVSVTLSLRRFPDDVSNVWRQRWNKDGRKESDGCTGRTACVCVLAGEKKGVCAHLSFLFYVFYFLAGENLFCGSVHF